MSEQTIQKILITGANGFIGKTLMRFYQHNNQAVVGVDLVGNGTDIIEGDIAKPASIANLLEECDVIIHTAALVSNAMEDSDMWRVNVLATRNLIDAAKKT
jgi:nucleoside-diphosphate-sugar epimerase